MINIVVFYLHSYNVQFSFFSRFIDLKGVSFFHVFADHVQNQGKLLTHQECWFLAGFGQALAESDGEFFSEDGVQVEDLADLVSDASIFGILKYEGIC